MAIIHLIYGNHEFYKYMYIPINLNARYIYGNHKFYDSNLSNFTLYLAGIITGRDEICGSLIETVNDLFPNKDLSIMRLKFMDSFTQNAIADSIKEVKDHARGNTKFYLDIRNEIMKFI